MSRMEVSFSAAKRRRIALNVLGSIAGLLAIVILLNWVGMRHFVRWHTDARDVSVLSLMTKEALKSLKQDINVVVLFESDMPLFMSINNLLKEYEVMTPHIKVKNVDYTQDPQGAEGVKNKYRLQLPVVENETIFRDLVIFETEGKPPRVIYEKEFSDFNVSDVAGGKEQKIKRIAFKGEMLFTAAIASLTENSKGRVAYFSTGHREHDLSDESATSGYSKFAEILEQNYVETKKLNVWAEGPIPKDCSLLVIGGPRDPFLDHEVHKISDYLNQGGCLLLLMPQKGNTKLEPLMKKWGVNVMSELVNDPLSNWQNNIIVTNFNVQSPISRSLFKSQMFIPLSRVVSKDTHATQAADAPQVTELFRSSKAGYLVQEKSENEFIPITPQKEPQEYSMAVSVEKGALQGVDSGKGTTRIVVTGNSQFLNNQWIDASYGNRDFVVLAVNWLLDRKQLMGGVGPRAIMEYQLNLSQTQVNLLMWIMLVIVPGIVLGLGLIVWVHQRN